MLLALHGCSEEHKLCTEQKAIQSFRAGIIHKHMMLLRCITVKENGSKRSIAGTNACSEKHKLSTEQKAIQSFRAGIIHEHMILLRCMTAKENGLKRSVAVLKSID